MLKTYGLWNGVLSPIAVENVAESNVKPLWVDMLDPTKEEERLVENIIGIPIPTRDEMHEIELSSRLYQKDGTLYTIATLVTNVDTPEPETHAVTFILTNDCLITVRYVNPRPYRIFLNQIESGEIRCASGSMLFAVLIELIVNRLADVLENLGHTIDDMTRSIFRARIDNKTGKPASAKPDFESLLQHIGANGDLVSKTRESLVSMNRLVSYILQSNHFKHGSEEYNRVKIILRDLVPLSDHASFLSNKVNFLLDATLGMISIEQNAIIKIFSVAAVVFLPPTLIASIYGMNFDFMPELHVHFAYPMAIILMIFSSYLPYKFFKRKGWL